MRGRRREVKDFRGDVRSDWPPGSSGLEGGRDGREEGAQIEFMVYKSLPMAVGCPTAKAALVHGELPLSRGEFRRQERRG